MENLELRVRYNGGLFRSAYYCGRRQGDLIYRGAGSLGMGCTGRQYYSGSKLRLLHRDGRTKGKAEFPQPVKNSSKNHGYAKAANSSGTEKKGAGRQQQLTTELEFVEVNILHRWRKTKSRLL